MRKSYKRRMTFVSILLAITVIFTATSCTFSDIHIEKKDDSSQGSEESEIDWTPHPEVVDEWNRFNEGERIAIDFGEPYKNVHVAGANGSGHMMVTVNKIEVYNTMAEAGINPEETVNGVDLDDNYRIDMDGNKHEIWGKERVFVLTYVTVENVDCVCHLSKEFPMAYDEYDFKFTDIGRPTTKDHEYYATDDVYFDKHNEAYPHLYEIFHLEPGEKEDFVIGTVVFTNGDVVNLEDIIYSCFLYNLDPKLTGVIDNYDN